MPISVCYLYLGYQCYYHNISFIIGLPLLSKSYVIDSLISYLSYHPSQPSIFSSLWLNYKLRYLDYSRLKCYSGIIFICALADTLCHLFNC